MAIPVYIGHKLRPKFFDAVGVAVFEWEWKLLGDGLCGVGFAERYTLTNGKEGTEGEDKDEARESWRLVGAYFEVTRAPFTSHTDLCPSVGRLDHACWRAGVLMC